MKLGWEEGEFEKGRTHLGAAGPTRLDVPERVFGRAPPGPNCEGPCVVMPRQEMVVEIRKKFRKNG